MPIYIMHTFSKSDRDHALGSLCILKTSLCSNFKIHEDPPARSLTYTKSYNAGMFIVAANIVAVPSMYYVHFTGI